MPADFKEENPNYYIEENTSKASRYEQLAEEAVELAHVAQKLARYLRGEQPLADDFDPDEEEEHLIEEYADVELAFDTAVEFHELTGYVGKKLIYIYDSKAERWKKRLQEKKKKEAGHEH